MTFRFVCKLGVEILLWTLFVPTLKNLFLARKFNFFALSYKNVVKSPCLFRSTCLQIKSEKDKCSKTLCSQHSKVFSLHCYNKSYATNVLEFRGYEFSKLSTFPKCEFCQKEAKYSKSME